MKISKLNIDRLPGIDSPFKINVNDGGFHVIHGPNGIGKSSICRGIEALLWAEHGPDRRTSVTGEFNLNDDMWTVERENERINWQRNGQESSPPFIPSADLRNCYFLKLRDLIDLSEDGTHDVATAIRKEMAGGVDLSQIIKDNFKTVKRPGQSENRDLESKKREIRRADGEQEKLETEADNLGRYRSQLKKAEDCQQERDNVASAVELVKYRTELNELKESISTFPSSLSKLNGSEYEDAQEALGQIETLEDRLIGHQNSHVVSLEKKEDSRLDAPIDQTLLDIWAGKEINLRNAKQDRDNKQQAQQKDQAKLDEALRAVGKADYDPKFELENHSEIFDFLRKAQKLRSTLEAIDARIQLLKDVTPSTEINPISNRASDGIEALRKWLRAGVVMGPQKSRWLLLVVCIAIAVAGAGLAWVINPWFASLTGLGIGLALTFAIRKSGQSNNSDADRAQVEFEKLGLDGPDDWSVASVELHLRDLELQLAEKKAEEFRARDRDVERKSLENERLGQKESSDEIDVERQGLIEKLNLKDIPPDVDLVDYAVGLDQLRLASLQERGAAEEMARAIDQYDEDFNYLADAIENVGETRPTDHDEVAAKLKNIIRRNTEFVQAVKDTSKAETDIIDTNRDMETVRARVKTIYETAELESENIGDLKELLADLSEYKDLVKNTNGLEAELKIIRRKLDQAGQLNLIDLNLEELDQKDSDLSDLADTAADLRDTISEIKAQIKLARSGNNIESLISERDEILSQLEDKRDQAIRAEAGQLLLATVEQEHETTQMPRVLADANQLFADFTHHSYKIELDKSGGQPRLIAINQTTNKRQSIGQLSDGTRAQLLLSARVAFAKEAEGGSPFPLFLDEALDQSDPARTHAIVRSLGRIARDQNRQIFYLTSDPSDLGRIQQALAEEGCEKAVEIDLGAIRSDIEAVGELSSLFVAPKDLVPEPASLSVEDYGALIKARPFDPTKDHSSQHLIHILWDQLNYLHEMLAIGVVSVGQWQSISDSDFIGHSVSQTIDLDQVGYRAEFLQVFCDLWQQGRGIPVDRDVLIDSKAISDKFMDGISEIADQLDGDGQALIKTINDRSDDRLAGFMRKKGDDLEQYLLDQGYIDEKPTLTEETLLPLALAAPVAAKIPPAVTSECLHRWWALGTK